MRKIPFVAGSLMLFVLLSASGLSAFFTDRVSIATGIYINGDPDIVLSEGQFKEENASGILPGSYVKKNPRVENLGEADRYVFCEVVVPEVNAKGAATPVFSYEKSKDWSMISSFDEEGARKEVYYYGNGQLNKLKKGEMTTALFDGVVFENPAGDASLSEKTLYLTVKTYSAVVDSISEETKDRTPANLWKLISADSHKSYVAVNEKDNKFVIGKLETLDEENAPGNKLEENIEGENQNGSGSGTGGQNSQSNQGTSDIGNGAGAGTGGNNSQGNQSTSGGGSGSGTGAGNNNQSFGGDTLPENPPINRITKLAKVVEDFPRPDPLVKGENVFKKTVRVQNTADYPQLMKVAVLFSDRNISDKSFFSPDNGTEFFSVSEYKDHLPEGWSYEENSMFGGMFVYNEVLNPGEISPSLFTHVRTDFEKLEYLREFCINILARGERRDV